MGVSILSDGVGKLFLAWLTTDIYLKDFALGKRCLVSESNYIQYIRFGVT